MIRCVPVSSTSDATTLIPIQDMKDWLKVDFDELVEDKLVQDLMDTAIQHVEERHNRAFLRRSFDAYLDETPREETLRLPRSPLVSITSVKGFSSTELTDTGGTAMSSSGYYADTASEPGQIALTGSVAWPTATRRVNPIIIRFVAGESTSASGVQDRAKTEVKQLVARLYEHRGDEAETAKVLSAYEQCPTDLSLPEWG